MSSCIIWRFCKRSLEDLNRSIDWWPTPGAKSSGFADGWHQCEPEHGGGATRSRRFPLHFRDLLVLPFNFTASGSNLGMVPGPRWLEARLFPLASSGSRNPMQSYRKMLELWILAPLFFWGKFLQATDIPTMLPVNQRLQWDLRRFARSEMNISIRSRPCSALDPDSDARFFGWDPSRCGVPRCALLSELVRASYEYHEAWLEVQEVQLWMFRKLDMPGDFETQHQATGVE